jgi:hypothetical protein
MIQCILEARVSRYRDTQQIIANVGWLDYRKRQGRTVGPPQSPHMQALLLRATNEGVNIVREEF